jgi:hypothetical protein
MSTSLFTAGNLAFRRDLMNQGEAAMQQVMTEFTSGGALSGSGVTGASNAALNYSATILPTNPQGVPTALINGAAFGAVGVAGNDITGTGGVTMRYVIDRMCNAAGVSTGANCVQSSAAPTGGPGDGQPQPPPPTATVYRISALISGPRNTQVFLQTTFTKPDS